MRACLHSDKHKAFPLYAVYQQPIREQKGEKRGENMPSSEGISTRVSVLGDKEYKRALQDIGRRLTMLNTEMAATNSAFGDQADSMEAMRAKASSLQSVYDAHAEKVKLIAEQLNKAKAEYGENSQQAENLQIALNRAANAMNKVGNEIKENDRNMAALSACWVASASAAMFRSFSLIPFPTLFIALAARFRALCMFAACLLFSP